MSKGFESTIGLEVHVQLNTRSKIFSPASTEFGAEPNTQACAIDLGLPGVLPVLNGEAVKMAIMFGLAVNAKIENNSIFARKNYFYPDLPKGYQISQYEIPIVSGGSIEIETENVKKRINITRAHLEEDAGKSIHDLFPNESAIDLNRAGTPLIEIVSEPDMVDAKEAVSYLKSIHSLVRYLEISDGNMQEGSFRCDANVSLKQKGSSELGTRAEIKNLNSFKFVEQAINYEIRRQSKLLLNNEKVIQETRLYDPQKNETRSMRSKEEANDYRYFPDPDLLPVEITEATLSKIRENMPELPNERKKRFAEQYKLNEYDIGILTSDKSLSVFFETILKTNDIEPKFAANWIITELLALANKHAILAQDIRITAEDFADLLVSIKNSTISSTQGKLVLEKMWETGNNPSAIIKSEGLSQISDKDELNKLVDNVLKNHYKSVEEYRNGKEKLFGFFVGEIMKESKGKASPQIVSKILKDKLKK
tara:strand:+ start:7555 stop:8994 length:1440 start_codon:yes stop_codon:yes gene_type:complete